MNQETQTASMSANLSMLVMSIASSAAVSLGLAPDPQAGKAQVDRKMAQFNIDLLVMLEGKTEGHRTTDEDRLLKALLADLQTKFLQLK